MDILDDMGASKLSAKVFLKVKNKAKILIKQTFCNVFGSDAFSTILCPILYTIQLTL